MKKSTIARVAFAVCAASMTVVMSVAMLGCSSGSSTNASSVNAASSGSNVAPVQTSSSDTVGSGPLAINLELKDSLDNEYAADSPNQFAEESLTVNVANGATALDVLESSGRDVETIGSGDSLEIQSIGGLARGDAGNGSHWEMLINGQIQRMSPNVVTMKAGDTLTFNFVQQESAK